MSPRQVLQYLTYPAVMLGGATLVVACSSEHGYWPVVPVILAGVAAIVVLLERLLPFERAWNQDLGDTRTDVAHLLANIGVSQLSLLIFTVASAAWPGIGGWPARWPFWSQTLLALLVLDLGLYGVHRASHGLGWLWRLHAIHHSSRRLYWMNGQRRHVVHEMLEGAPGLLTLFLLGAPPTVCACAIAIITIHLMLQHANIDYRLGPFSRVLAAAETHRWHHQRRWQEVQGNYGAVLAIWDVLCGTALPQREIGPVDVGIDDEPSIPSTFLAQVTWPFVPRS